MKLSTLRYFITTAKCGSFTRASEKLFISQPTLSRQIQDLEEELGIKLFDRGRKTLRLTKNGELLFHEASAIVERCDRLPELFHPEVRGVLKQPNILKLGFQRSFNAQWIFQAINRVRQGHPNADILLTQGTVSELTQGLKAGHFDAIFTLQAYARQLPNTTFFPFRGNRLQLVVPAQHPLASMSHVKIGALENEDMILLNRQHSPVIVDYVISLCVKNGFSPNGAYYIDSLEEGLTLAGAGKGITFIHSEMNVTGLEERYNVKILDINEKETELAFVIVFHEQNRNPLLQQLIDSLE